MKRLLIWTVMSTCLLGFVAGAGAQDESAADRADRRAAERAARDQERADRARDRVEEQARRSDERQQRRLDRQHDWDDGAHILFGQNYELAEGSTAT